ncbi:hypothetical protein Vafri_7204 [Volvox africanus]|uniref:Uncharacterized protein n=1 Tax=Volvox africanus TaxID=51714 RepID=A0A8J4AZW2_9CHLO|nr:hypothetical protein Vafri_7204 [Volvox africanus]
MDDVRSLQEACLRDRQERDQWHHAFLSEQEKCKNLQLRLTLEAEHAAKLLDTVSQRRKAQQGEVTAAISYQKTLLELTALQETHLESVQAHHVQLEMLQDELDKARRTMAALAADLDKERKDRAVQVADLTTQLQERAAASAAEMAALHESYGGQLALLEDFKNQLLEDKAAAEERWGKERAALKAESAAAATMTAAAVAAGGGSGEAAWKARLMRLRGEAEVIRRERDAAHAALQAAGITAPPPSTGAQLAPAAGMPAGGAIGGGSGLSAQVAANGTGSWPEGNVSTDSPVFQAMHPQKQALRHAYEPGQHQQHQHPHQLQGLQGQHQQHQQQQLQHQQQISNQQPPPAGYYFTRGSRRGGVLGGAPRIAVGRPICRPGPGEPGGGTPFTPQYQQQQQPGLGSVNSAAPVQAKTDPAPSHPGDLGARR